MVSAHELPPILMKNWSVLSCCFFGTILLLSSVWSHSVEFRWRIHAFGRYWAFLVLFFLFSFFLSAFSRSFCYRNVLIMYLELFGGEFVVFLRVCVCAMVCLWFHSLFLVVLVPDVLRRQMGPHSALFVLVKRQLRMFRRSQSHVSPAHTVCMFCDILKVLIH